MTETAITFTLTHTVSHLSDNEKYPVVECYLDSRWERESVEVQLTRKKSQSVTVHGTLAREITSLPPTAGIGFASFAWRPNECGNMCKMDAGTTEVYFSEILRGLKESKDGSFTVDLELTMNTVQYYKKGTIRVSFTADGLHGLPATVYDTVSAHIGEQLTEYVNTNMQIEQGMEELMEGTESMRIPYNFSEVGMKCTNGAPLPAASYVLAEIPKTNDLFWENAYKVCMRRIGMKPEEWNRLSLVGKADMACKVVCYLPQYLDYIGDTIDKNAPGKSYQRSLVIPCENFGDALATVSGDCEDLAGAIGQLKNALCRHSFSQRSEYYKQLTEIQSIMHQYMNPLSLDVVRGAQVNHVAQLGAHMNDNFIPIELFERWSNPKPRSGEGLDNGAPRGGGKDSVFPQSQSPSATGLGYPFMIGEGTGMYIPYGSTPLATSLAPVARYVFSNSPSMEGFKKPLEHKPKEIGSFFIGSLVGMTDYYYQKGANAPMSFWYTTNGKRGATYDDMINHPERVCIKMQPTIGTQLMKHVEEAIKLRVPPKPVTLTEAGIKHQKNKHLDRVCAAINGMKRSPGSETNRVAAYVRPHQIGVRVADAMINDFSRLERVWKLEYRTEPITDAIWGFELLIYVK